MFLGRRGGGLSGSRYFWLLGLDWRSIWCGDEWIFIDGVGEGMCFGVFGVFLELVMVLIVEVVLIVEEEDTGEG